MTGKPETALQTAIADALRNMGVWVMVMNVTKRRGKRRGVNCGEPGMPDLWTEYGWLEVKLPGNDLDPDQVTWRSRAERSRVNVETVRSIADAVEVIQDWTRYLRMPARPIKRRDSVDGL